MKGDGYIKNIILKFIGVGIKEYYQAYVKVFGKDNKLIYSGYTYNGEIKLLVCKDNIYRVEAYFYDEFINNTFLVTNDNTYVFWFNHVIYKGNNTITFLLTDYNYTNLPIERGSIIVWQKQ